MSSPKSTLTIHDFLCCAFIFASFFHGFSRGFTWIQTPRPKTSVEIGKTVSLHWHYNLPENETHVESDLLFLKGKMSSTLASRNATADSFQNIKSDRLGKFEVQGTQDISLILKDVQESSDGSLCLKVKYKFGGIIQDWKMNCTELYSVERPIIYSGPKNVTVNENDTMTLQCKARGKPRPKITWTKGDQMDIISTGETLRKARAGKCDSGIYRCTADNGVKARVSAQAAVTIQSYPEAPKILRVVASSSSVKVHWKEPPVTNCSLPNTGYIAQIRKNGSRENWMECEGQHVSNYEWTCTFSELENGASYILQIFAKNAVGTGKVANSDFKFKYKSKTEVTVSGSSKTVYIIIGAIFGGIALFCGVVCVCKCCNNTNNYSSL